MGAVSGWGRQTGSHLVLSIIVFNFCVHAVISPAYNQNTSLSSTKGTL